MASQAREHWGSRLGFILAAAGSAVGLGNLWKFPYVAYDNDGGAFVLFYLFCIVVVGLPIMVAEIIIGRRSERDLVGAFRVLKAGQPLWRIVGWLGIATAFIILSYYSVVAGWTLEYTVRSLSGLFAGMTAEQISDSFVAFLGNPYKQLLWHAVFMGLTVAVVLGGIHGGIERWAKILMPILVVLLVSLAVYAMIVGDAAAAIDFLFSASAPLTGHGVLEALGHAFFTLSLGMAVMVTYGSYLQRDQDIGKVALTVTVVDTLVALTACMLLYPIVFAYDLPIAESIGIIFTAMPFVFQQMPGGPVVAPLFFALIAFAALSSTISLLEVVVTFAKDELGWDRRKAATWSALTVFLFGVPSALCNGAVGWLSEIRIFSKGREQLNWLDSFDYLASNWLLPIGGMAIALFAGWALAPEARREEYGAGEDSARIVDYRLWSFAVRFVAPVAVLVVLLFKVGVIG